MAVPLSFSRVVGTRSRFLMLLAGLMPVSFFVCYILLLLPPLKPPSAAAAVASELKKERKDIRSSLFIVSSLFDFRCP